MIICFHGTDKKKVKRILREGFHQGTYFARHLEDALEFGGPCVFFVRFDNGEPEKSGRWQFRTGGEVPASAIWKVVHYDPKELFENSRVVE